MLKARSFSFVVVPGLVSFAVGCGPEETGEADAFRAALPLVESVKVDGPETTVSSGSETTVDTDVNAPYATYYKFTRKVRDDVNAVTTAVLGSVWFVAHTRPTRVTVDEAVWGPYTDSLEPATYRFRIQKETDGAYRYTYEGRPKESTSDTDYQVVVEGVGYGQSDARHGDGYFTIDLDVARFLDPVKNEDDSGTIRIEHDLPVTVTSEVHALPRHIEVDAQRSDTDEAYAVTSDAFEDNTGALVVEAVADLDPTGLTKSESVKVLSQWNAQGEGRSDVSFTGGDVPAVVDPVTAVECWNSSFKRSYYHDSAGSEADYGQVAACAYDEALK